MRKSLIAVSCLGAILAGGLLLAQDKEKDKGKAPAAPAVAGDAKKGKATFDGSCGICHDAVTTEAKIGPGLKGLTKRAKLVNDAKMSDESLLKLLKEGTQGGMPPFGETFKAAEFTDLMAYLKSL